MSLSKLHLGKNITMRTFNKNKHKQMVSIDLGENETRHRILNQKPHINGAKISKKDQNYQGIPISLQSRQ